MRYLLIILLLPMVASGTIVNLTSGDLPYTASTDDDTLRISGTAIYSGTNGINVTASGVFLDLGEDSLIFDTAGGGNHYGIRLYSSADSCIISGGLIVHGCDDADTSEYNTCLKMYPNIDNWIEDTYFYVKSWASNCIQHPSNSGMTYNYHFKKCEFVSDCSLYYSRGDFQAAMADLIVRCHLGPDSFHFVIDSCEFTKGFHSAAHFSGAASKYQVVGASNASPIVIDICNLYDEEASHYFSTGDIVEVEHVEGNTAANGIWEITVTDPNSFSLDGSTGNGAFVVGDTAGRATRDMRVRAHVFGSHFMTDDRNYLYEWDSCGTPGDACGTYLSSANGYDIAFWHGGPSIIENNVCSSGVDIGGSRIILLDNCLGASGDSTIVRNNQFIGNEGPYGEALGAYGKCTIARIRSIDGENPCGFIAFRNNTIRITCDSSLATPNDATPAFGYEGRGLFISNRSYDSGHVVIENNTFESVANSDSVFCYGIALGPFVPDKDFIFRNNHFKYDDIGIFLGVEYDCDSVVFTGDTFTLHTNPTYDRTAIWVDPSSMGGRDAVNNIFRNCTWLSNAADTSVNFGTLGSNDGEITFQELIHVYVKSNTNDMLISDADIYIENDYDVTVHTGGSASRGYDSAFVSYYYVEESGSDSAKSSFNPFYLIAEKGEYRDSVEITIDYNYTDIDTVYLATDGDIKEDGQESPESGPPISGITIQGVTIK